MTPKDTPSGTVAVHDARTLVSRYDDEAVSGELLARLMDIPEGEGTGTGIIADALNVTSLDELKGEASKLPKALEVAGRVLIVDLAGMTRRTSTIEGEGLPEYLIIPSVDKKRGTEVLWQSSASSVVAKLVTARMKLHLDWIECETKAAAKKTERGYTPVNLIVYDGGTGTHQAFVG